MKKSVIKATSIRLLMIFLLLLFIGLSFGGFYYIQNSFRNQAADLNLNNTGTPKDNDTSKIDSLTIQKENAVTTITKDLDIYEAAISPGLTQSYDFSASAVDSPIFSSNKIKLQPVIITIKNPVKYTDLVKFIKAVETNIPKINLKKLNIERSLDSSENVNVDPIEAEVYIR